MSSPATSPSPAVATPTLDEIKTIGREVGLTLSDSDAQSFIGLMAVGVGAYNGLAQMPDNLPPVKYPRGKGERAKSDENKNNAWYWKARVEGARNGKLKGKTIALKDNVMLAGVPMMNGSATLEGYVPEVDATIVTRILDAGGTILGKAHCEAFCASAGSHTNATGPVHNPHRHGYSAGGSSSGSAALVAAGEVDMAIGGDQGGSIRVPSAHCGTYGMKATHGLVPYTGIFPIEPTIDHAGPITGNVRDNALLLEAIAGADGLDPRQYSPRVQPYSQLLDGGAKGLKIGVLKEGFAQPNSEGACDEKVRKAAALFAKLGASVGEVSIPMHLIAGAVFLPIIFEGATATMMLGDGYGVSRSDLYVTSLMDYHRNWRGQANKLSETVKLFTLFGSYIRKKYGGKYYGKAINLARQLTAAYDATLAQVDLLLMPTTPMKARPMPKAGASREEYVGLAIDAAGSTSPFDITHHPAMSVPCGMIDGLPVGMMLVGRHFDEPTIYRAAYAFEQAGDWKTM
ncbi:MAG: amidase [Alphaproteobacteria bacterium]|nr:amidase [Alphaproteobacteria bacterium]